MKKSILIFAILGLVVACSESKAQSPSTAKVEAPADNAQEKVSQKSDKAEKSAAKEALKKEAPKPAKVEAGAVSPTEFKEEQFPGELPPGKLVGGLSFNDSVGANFVVFTIHSRDKSPDNDTFRRNTLHIKHVVLTADKLEEVRSYKEIVDNCPSETEPVLTPKFGDWSITDFNQNGVGEVSFAYSADCMGDNMPLKHKAFVTEGGAKYVLRGESYFRWPEQKAQGGKYKADKMSAEFLKHADMVWEKTSRDQWFEKD